MKLAQNITDEIISQIQTAIGNDTHGDGIAVFDTDGRVVSLAISSSGEREYFGLNDTKGNRFYIRLNGSVTESRITGNQKRGSCGVEDRTRIPMRLVAQHVCEDPRTLVEGYKRALYRVNLPLKYDGFSLQYIRIIPVSMNPIPWDVFAAETKKDPADLVSFMQIIAIDFVLEYQYNYADKCPIINIC
jgi:hypothetical protein